MIKHWKYERSKCNHVLKDSNFKAKDMIFGLDWCDGANKKFAVSMHETLNRCLSLVYLWTDISISIFVEFDQDNERVLLIAGHYSPKNFKITQLLKALKKERFRKSRTLCYMCNERTLSFVKYSTNCNFINTGTVLQTCKLVLLTTFSNITWTWYGARLFYCCFFRSGKGVDRSKIPSTCSLKLQRSSAGEERFLESSFSKVWFKHLERPRNSDDR